MSTDRSPCPNCGSLILHVTVKYNDGLCAPCKSSRDYALHQKQQQEGCRNTSPPPIKHSGFTKKEFIQGLAMVCLPHRDEPEKVSEEFLGFCEPILQSRLRIPLLKILFHRRQLYHNLKRIPRPYRDLMAVYQAWGMITSDGFESYVENTIRKFDQEVELGLDFLGQKTAKGVVSDARRVCRKNGGEILKEIDNELWKRFYDSMENFESDVLGKRLIIELTSAEQA